jgi:SAM-dependent methyltransferase
MSKENAAQFEAWNTIQGNRWVQNKDLFVRQLASHTAPILDAAALTPGQSVVDLGCGFGVTTMKIADIVGDTGHVLGLDFSEVMIAEASAQAQDRGISNITFEQADVQSYQFEPHSHDTAISRYGVMFYEDPIAAFTNVHRALKDKGRIAYICWRTPQENIWMSGPTRIAGKILDLPPPPPPGSPGIFGFADRDHVSAIMTRAGFSEISIEPVDLTAVLGDDIEHAVANALKIAPWISALENADAQAIEDISSQLRDLYRDYQGPNGIEIPSASWVVSAQA